MVIKGATIFITHKGKLLLIHRDNIPTIDHPNKWSALSGGTEPGETAEETIRRECMEEINIVPKNIKFIGYSNDRGRFTAELSQDEVKNIKLGDEGQNLGFFTLEEMETMDLTPKVKHSLETKRFVFEKLLRNETVTPEELGYK
jgi:8-oxo-dGTP diphosphatase